MLVMQRVSKMICYSTICYNFRNLAQSDKALLTAHKMSQSEQATKVSPSPKKKKKKRKKEKMDIFSYNPSLYTFRSVLIIKWI